MTERSKAQFPGRFKVLLSLVVIGAEICYMSRLMHPTIRLSLNRLHSQMVGRLIMELTVALIGISFLSHLND